MRKKAAPPMEKLVIKLTLLLFFTVSTLRRIGHWKWKLLSATNQVLLRSVLQVSKINSLQRK